MTKDIQKLNAVKRRLTGRLSNLCVIVICCCLPLLIQAQGKVTFSASSDAKQVVLGGNFEVSFILENANGGNFKPPPFKKFTVLNGPNQSMSTTSVNGQWSRTLSYSYNLQPKKIGKFSVGPASITANGKTYSTKPVVVEVVQGKSSTATTQEDLVAQIENEIFIKAVPYTREAYIGQQILVDYKIYTTKEIESYNLLDESKYAGFYAQDIRRFDSRVLKEVIDGVQFSTKVLKRVALFPQQAGLLKIDPMKMQIAIIAPNQPKRRRSFFYTPALTRLQLATDEIGINVRTLPTNVPPSFTGGVGKYLMSATLNRTSLTTDDAVSLRITINGNGDIKQVQAPELVLSDSFEVYDPNIVDESSFVEQNGQFTGRKTYEYLILPKVPGRYQIRPEFSYYDTDSLRYITIQSRPLPIVVGQGTNKKTNIDRTPPNASSESIIRSIMTDTSLSQKGNGFVGSSFFWILFGLPFLLLGGAYAYRQVLNKKNNIDGTTLKRNRANKVAQQRLTKAKIHLDQGKSRPFYDEISRGMLGYVCDKLNIPLSELSKENVVEKLTFLKVSAGPIENFKTMIQTCEKALYAGMDNESAMKDTYEKAISVVADVEEEIGK